MRIGSGHRGGARLAWLGTLIFAGVSILIGVAGCTATTPRAVSPSGELEIVRDAARVEQGGPRLVDAPRVRRASRPGWVEVEAAIMAGDDESPAAARRRALRRARQAAVEFVAGVSVRTSVLALDHVSDETTSDLLQVLTATQAHALVVDEQLLDSRLSMSDRGDRYEVRVKLLARVLEHDRSAAGFETEVRLDGSSYRPGDRVQLAVRVSEPARIYVLAVSDAGATVLLPNRHLRDTRIEAEEWLEFPGDELAGRGVAMHAALPEGRSRSQEALIVVALRGRRRLENLFPAAGDAFRSASGHEAMALASEFLAPLLSIPASEWTFDQIVYSISDD